MRKILKEAKSLLKTVGEELAALDHRTDITKFIIQHVLLNDEEEESDADDFHFGIISSITASLLFLGAAWAIISAMLILL